MAKLILREKLYVPIQLLDRDEVEQKYTKRVFKEQACQRCPYLEDRFGENCEECPNHLGLFRLYSKTEIGNHEYYGLPYGNRKRLKSLLPKLKAWRAAGKIIDKRPRPKLRYKWKFKKSKPLYDYQQEPIKDIVASGYGVLEAPPRSGKTLMGIRIAINLGYKTLILAHQEELLDQFMETFTEFTNYKALTEEHGNKTAGICNKVEDFAKYDIVLSTYQKFISKGNGVKRLRKIRDMFGTIIVDETHRSAAKCYSKVINSLNARHKVGLTGTVERKDSLHFLVTEIIGPVKARAKKVMLVPNFEFVRSPVESGRQFNNWTWFCRFLANHKERNKLIVQEAVKYMKQGRSVVIPITFVNHAKKLADAINKEMGKNVAVSFTGQGNTKETRKAMLEKARSGVVTCFIGMRQLVQEGINVPLWSVLLEVMPISNPPKFQQETARIRTPMPGKLKPIIRMLCDDLSISRGCMRTCYYQGAMKLGFDVSKEDRARFKAFCAGKMPKTAAKIGKSF